MADKLQKISVSAFEKRTNEIYEPTTAVEWGDLTIMVKKHLSLAEVVKFVDVCTKACFNQDDASYVPEARDPAIRSCIVAFYTNITLPENITKQYDLIYHSHIVDVITPNIDRVQLESIIRSVDKKIDYISSANINLVNKQITELFDVIGGLQKQVSNAFENVSSDDIKKAIDALSSGAFDEEKLVQAYMSTKVNNGKDEEDNA